MANYTNEYSSFPDSVMSEPTYKDVTEKVAALINQIKNFQAAGDYKSAAAFIAANPSIQDYIVGAEFFNTIIEEQRNTEIYAKTAKQFLYTGAEPATPVSGDVWIGDD